MNVTKLETFNPPIFDDSEWCNNGKELCGYILISKCWCNLFNKKVDSGYTESGRLMKKHINCKYHYERNKK